MRRYWKRGQTGCCSVGRKIVQRTPKFCEIANEGREALAGLLLSCFRNGRIFSRMF